MLSFLLILRFPSFKLDDLSLPLSLLRLRLRLLFLPMLLSDLLLVPCLWLSVSVEVRVSQWKVQGMPGTLPLIPELYKVILLPVSYIPFASAEIFPLRQIFVFLLASKIIAGGDFEFFGVQF